MGCCSTKAIPQHNYNVWDASQKGFNSASGPPSSILIICNPYSGGKRGEKVLSTVQEALEANGVAVTVLRTEFAGHAKQLALMEDISSFDVISSIGGDGTVHEVVNGLLQSCQTGRRSLSSLPPLAIIPCGSGNTFAYDMGILTVQDALTNILAFHHRYVDVLEVSKPDSPHVSMSRDDAAGKEQEEVKQEGETEAKQEGEDAVAAAETVVSEAVGAAQDAAVDAAAHAEGAVAAASASISDSAGGAGVSSEVAAIQAEAHRVEEESENAAAGLLSAATSQVATAASAVESAASAVEAEAKAVETEAEAVVEEAKAVESEAKRVEAEVTGASPADVVMHTDDRTAAEIIYSINIVGFGLPASVLRTANSLRCCGGAQYNCAAYSEIFKMPRYPATIEFPGSERAPISGDWSMVQVQQTVHMGAKMPYCPRGKLDDGLMDMVNIPYLGRKTAVDIMEAAKKGTHIEHEAIKDDYLQIPEIVLRADNPLQSGPLTLNVDGELAGYTPARIKCLPRVLSVVVPPPSQ